MRCAAVSLALFFAFLPVSFSALAGPPFRTDDPDPVEYQHWEVYLASQYQNDRSGVSATAPHVEINYGVWPDFQLHLIAPMEYAKPDGRPSHYGYGDTELGVKWRFYNDEETKFMAGSFPLLEIPTGDESKGLGNGDPQVYLPIWLQKTWGPWLTYGGGGYWINPDEGHRDFEFLGWLLQRDLNKYLAVGAEIFYQTPSETDGKHEVGFNTGAIISITQNHQILISAGTDISGTSGFFSYVAYYFAYGPGKEDAPAGAFTEGRRPRMPEAGMF